MQRLEERGATRKAAVPPEAKSEPRELVDRYLAWMVATRYAEDTLKSYGADFAWFLRYLEQHRIDRIADVTRETAVGYSLWLRYLQNSWHEDRKIAWRTSCLGIFL